MLQFDGYFIGGLDFLVYEGELATGSSNPVSFLIYILAESPTDKCFLEYNAMMKTMWISFLAILL